MRLADTGQDCIALLFAGALYLPRRTPCPASLTAFKTHIYQGRLLALFLMCLAAAADRCAI